MRGSLLRLSSLLFALLLVLATGCSDSSSSNGGGDGGNGGTDTGNGGTDTGNGDTGNGGGSGTLGGPNCSITPNAQAPASLGDGAGGTRDVRIIIEGVDFSTDTVHIRNVSGADIDFNEDWRMVVNGASSIPLTNAPTISAGAVFRWHISENFSGTSDDDDYFINNGTILLFACGGDVGIQFDPEAVQRGGWSDRPGNVEAYVRWGVRQTPGNGSSINDEAFDAGAWEFDFNDENTAIEICYDLDVNASFCGATGFCTTDDEGLIATGDVTSPSSWQAVGEGEGADCL